MKDFNEQLALTITQFVSSMWCAYLFAIIALVTLPTAIIGGLTSFIPWLAQTFLQLVLLSVIMVGQDIQSRESQKKLDQILNKILTDEEQEILEEQVILEKLGEK